MNAPIKLDRSMKRQHSVGGFGIEILFPGLRLKTGDSGIGAIGRIDQARITPGTTIAMHPHKDDEILTYLRSGKVIHRDTVGAEEQISNTRLMLMNAGHTFQHEEHSLPEGGLLEALQIFIRPRAPDLEPLVQFHDFGAAHSDDAWRLIAGPTGAPLTLRAEAWIHDARLAAGLSLALPKAPVPNAERLLYVFSGKASVAGIALTAGESLIIGTEPYEVVADDPSDLVLFTTDMSAPVFKHGMFSGNVLAGAD
jgi:redox-sensitive bicupin YhaK (pirin superfamily)